MSVDPGTALPTVWELIATGDLNAAASTAQTLLFELTDPHQRAEASAAFGTILYGAGRATQARRWLSDAVHLSEDEPRLQATYSALLANVCLLLADVRGAERNAGRARLLGDRHGNRFATTEGLSVLAGAALAHGRPEEALRLSKQAVSVRSTISDGHGLTPASYAYHGLALLELDRLREADEALTEGLRRATNAPTQAPAYRALRALVRMIHGHWDDALVDADVAIAEAQRTGALLARPIAWSVAAMIHANRGDHSAALRYLADAKDPLTSLGDFGSDWLAMARASVATDSASALDALSEGWLHTRHAPYFVSWRFLGPGLVRLALRHGDTSRAAIVSAACHEGSGRSPKSASAVAAALRCTALIDQDLAAARACLDHSRRSDRAFAHAVAALDLVPVLEQGSRAEATAAVREAAGIFAVLGAVPWLARAGRELQRLAPGVPAPRAELPPGWSLLTPTEREVAGHVADGLTNPAIAELLFVSPRTVQTHTSHIYAKLGVSSRVQLSALLRRRTSA